MIYQFFICCALLLIAPSLANSSRDKLFLNEDFRTGYIPVNRKDSLFYWLFEAKNNPCHAPLVVYLAGGPGCSGEIAIFTGAGPYRINKDDLTLKSNPGAWNRNFNMLFVDQPVGTGFSNSKNYRTDESHIAVDFYTFLEGFLKKHPEYKKSSFYLTGEGYAGHFIPSIASYILKNPGLKLNLKGVAIGNGYYSMAIQAPPDAPFAFKNGLISEELFETVHHQLHECADELIASGFTHALSVCYTAEDLIAGEYPNWKFNPHYYTIKNPVPGTTYGYDWSSLDAFLAQDKVKSMLGVKGKSWTQCNMDVMDNLRKNGQDILDYSGDLSFLVQSNLQVLMYNGVLDYMCNWFGGERVANSLSWNKSTQFGSLEYTKWNQDGEYKNLDNLTFLKLNDAGHFAAMDKPEVTLKMIEKFVNGWK